VPGFLAVQEAVHQPATGVASPVRPSRRMTVPTIVTTSSASRRTAYLARAAAKYALDSFRHSNTIAPSPISQIRIDTPLLSTGSA